MELSKDDAEERLDGMVETEGANLAKMEEKLKHMIGALCRIFCSSESAH